MDDFFVTIGVLLGLTFLILPVISFVLLIRARRRVSELEREQREHGDKLAWLYAELSELKKRSAVAAVAVPTTPPPEAAPVAPPEPAPIPSAPGPAVAPEADTWVPGALPAAAAADADANADAPPPPLATPPPPATPPPAPRPVAVARPLEQSVATWFTRIGAGALLLGALYFFKYAADNEWIGPMGRVLIGAVVGLVLLVLAETLRDHTKAAFSHALVGVGLAILYVSAWASSSLYQLLPTEAAFGANTVIVGLGAALAFRHKGEAILVLVAVAGFLNPVLLSTGVDRPLALYAYLLLLTTGTLYVAVHHGFRVALLLSILGVALIYSGWYDKFFQTFDYRSNDYGLDRPEEELVGAYHSLSARVVPLAFTALFLGQWLATAFALRAKASLPGWVKPIATLGLVLGHLAVTSLLFDRAPALGVGVVLLAAVSVAALYQLDAKNLLLIPMVAVFFGLAAHTTTHRDTGQTQLLALLGVWSGIYVVAFLRDAEGKFRKIAAGDAWRAAVALGAFQVLAMLLLLPTDRYLEAAAALALSGLVVALVAARAEQVSLQIAGVLVGTFFLAGAAAVGQQLDYPEGPGAWDPAFLGLALVHCLGHLAGAVWLSGKLRPAKGGALLAVVLPGLGFLLLALVSTSAEVPTLRAIATASVGAADLLLAIYYARRRPEPATHPTALAALALGLFAPALAFGFSGVTITVLWALLFVVAAFLTKEAREPVWLVVTVGLALATFFRLFVVDIAETQAELNRWYGSGGRYGLYALPVLFNARAYALLGTGLGCLAAAFALVKARVGELGPQALKPGLLRGAAAIFAIFGYAFLTGLLVSEVRGALVDLPPPPPFPLDYQELAAFWETVTAHKAAAAGLVNMSSTMVLALVGILLLGAGFALKDAFHRYLGLVVFLATIGKLVLWDVWNLPRIYQVGVLTVVGILLLGSGFLYARLKVLFTGPTAAAGLLFACSLGAAEARAEPQAALVPVGSFQQRGTIEGITGPGDYRLPLGAEIYAASKSDALFADLRIADEAGREVPYYVHATAPTVQSRWYSATMYDPGRIEGDGYRATFELPEGSEHCMVRLDLQGSDFLRRTMIESGSSPNDLTLLTQGGVVYSISGMVGSRDAELRYPRSIARYLRITLLSDADAELTTIRGAEFSCAPAETIPAIRSIPLAIVDRQRNEELKTTILTLDAGMEGVPIDRLAFESTTPEFVRKVELAASSYKSAWPSVGGGVLYRVSTGQHRPEQLAIGVASIRKRWWRVTIYDRDDSPLEITGVTGLRPEDELVLRARQGGLHTLYVGDPKGGQPYYDLAALHADREVLPSMPVVGVRGLEANPSLGQAPERADLPATERHRAAIGWALGAVLVGLSFWAVRVLRRPSTTTS